MICFAIKNIDGEVIKVSKDYKALAIFLKYFESSPAIIVKISYRLHNSEMYISDNSKPLPIDEFWKLFIEQSGFSKEEVESYFLKLFPNGRTIWILNL